MSENPNALKHMYNEDFLKRMSSALRSVHSSFEENKMLQLKKELLTLEMKPRVLLVRDFLKESLPSQYLKALKILLKASEKLSGFDLWPVTEYIQAYGLEHSKESLDALKKITTIFTSEFAVRPFLIKHEYETLEYLLKCADDKDFKVRRWASEGSRPRLPWGMKLHHFIAKPELTIQILDKLWNDPEIFVRKSVANHLNDIAKDHPDLVIKTLVKWKSLVKKKDQETSLTWIINHSLRTLIKQGHPEALKLLGVENTSKFKASELVVDRKKFKINDRMKFSIRITSLEKKTKKFVIDYAIHFRKSDGKNAAKVFKLKTLEIDPGAQISLEKSHHLKAVTTRVHYPGIHYLEILVNGKSAGKVQWDLRLK